VGSDKPSAARDLAERLIIYGPFRMPHAIQAAVNGNPRLLSRLLCSSPSLTRREQKLLAAYFEGKFNRKRGRPRGSELTPLRRRRILAAKIFREVKRSLKQSGELVREVRQNKAGVKESGEGYTHKLIVKRYTRNDIVKRLAEMMNERGKRISVDDIASELKHPTRIYPRKK
jgi:hypothetical protein